MVATGRSTDSVYPTRESLGERLQRELQREVEGRASERLSRYERCATQFQTPLPNRGSYVMYSVKFAYSGRSRHAVTSGRGFGGRSTFLRSISVKNRYSFVTQSLSK